jgi:hypothetical protein
VLCELNTDEIDVTANHLACTPEVVRSTQVGTGFLREILVGLLLSNTRRKILWKSHGNLIDDFGEGWILQTSQFLGAYRSRCCCCPQ